MATEERKRHAYHEAGHAVARYKLGGVFRYAITLDRHHAVVFDEATKLGMEKEAVISLAGRAAAELEGFPPDPLVVEDFDLGHVRRLIEQIGGDPDELMVALQQRTDELLAAPGVSNAVRALAQALLQDTHHVVCFAEAEKIMSVALEV